MKLSFLLLLILSTSTLADNTASGNDNTALGNQSMKANTTGGFNTAN